MSSCIVLIDDLKVEGVPVAGDPESTGEGNNGVGAIGANGFGLIGRIGFAGGGGVVGRGGIVVGGVDGITETAGLGSGGGTDEGKVAGFNGGNVADTENPELGEGIDGSFTGKFGGGVTLIPP